MAQWMPAAEYSGGEVKRQRSMAHKALYSLGIDAFLGSSHRDSVA
jgi:hypothetical protein